MTNKLLARFATQVFITLEESAKFFPKEKILITGNPLRRQILDLVEKAQPSAFSHGDSEQPFRLFVFGGSQGAHAINMAMIDALPELKKVGVNVTITHQTGAKDLEMVTAAYRRDGIDAQVTAFISDMAAEYKKADLIICRAGATTIAEVTACGKACLFIPFPYAVDDHQRRNAEALLKKDACFMVLEQELKNGTLANTITTLMADPALVRRTGSLSFGLAKLDAAKIIVDEMVQTK
jgi:UDP-N-acetylglucosamine--N-acetylmuramyl-(pentapeptide) pyrophosphoryl-undecaprenol N-acetylglucosamine transferase